MLHYVGPAHDAVSEKHQNGETRLDNTQDIGQTVMQERSTMPSPSGSQRHTVDVEAAKVEFEALRRTLSRASSLHRVATGQKSIEDANDEGDFDLKEFLVRHAKFRFYAIVRAREAVGMFSSHAAHSFGHPFLCSCRITVVICLSPLYLTVFSAYHPSTLPCGPCLTHFAHFHPWPTSAPLTNQSNVPTSNPSALALHGRTSLWLAEAVSNSTSAASRTPFWNSLPSRL